MATACIRCGGGLKDVWDGMKNSPPKGGTQFRTYGHSGSGVFDPMDDTFIEVNICDPCLLTLLDMKQVGHDHNVHRDSGYLNVF